LIDVLVSATLLILREAEVWLGPGAGSHREVYAIVNAAMALTVAIRRSYPTAAGAAAGLLSLAAGDFWGPPDLSTYALSWGLAMYGLAVWSRPRPFVATVVGFGVALAASAALGLTRGGFPQFVLTWLVALLLARFLVGDREQRLQLAERERDLSAREVLLEERQRIARELHDVIAHEVSMIVVQAGAERRALGAASPSTREVLQTIENVGRSALEEMRRMVGMLRANDRPEPQPGLRDLHGLVGRLRESGLPIDLRIDGERRELPAGLELCAYRVVQEALTNAVKHAGQAKVSVRVDYRPQELVLEVIDDGRGSDLASLGGGHVQGKADRRKTLRRRLPGLGATATSMTKVLIADDQALVRIGLRKIITSEPGMEVIAEASDGESAITAALKHRPEVVLMDIRMPVVDGIEATGRISASAPDVRVLILTTFALDEYIYGALRAGASGFMLKDAPPEEILGAIRIVARGEALLAPAVTRTVIETFMRQPVLVSGPPRELEELTPREREVFDLVVQGLSNPEIGSRLKVSEATAKTHVARVLDKLGVRDRVQAVIYAYERGLVTRVGDRGPA